MRSVVPLVTAPVPEKVRVSGVAVPPDPNVPWARIPPLAMVSRPVVLTV